MRIDRPTFVVLCAWLVGCVVLVGGSAAAVAVFALVMALAGKVAASLSATFMVATSIVVSREVTERLVMWWIGGAGDPTESRE